MEGLSKKKEKVLMDTNNSVVNAGTGMEKKWMEVEEGIGSEENRIKKKIVLN